MFNGKKGEKIFTRTYIELYIAIFTIYLVLHTFQPTMTTQKQQSQNCLKQAQIYR